MTIFYRKKFVCQFTKISLYIVNKCYINDEIGDLNVYFIILNHFYKVIFINFINFL